MATKKLFSVCLGLCLSAHNLIAGIITFENVPQDFWFAAGGQNLGNYFEGVTFGPDATILETEVFGYNSAAFPPHSVVSVLFPSASPFIEAVLDQPADNVSLWYSSAVDLVLEAYDEDDNLITFSLGAPVIGANNFIEVSSLSSNIKRVIIHNDVNTFVIDDFQAPTVSGQPSQVPEPNSIMMMLMGISCLALFRKRK